MGDNDTAQEECWDLPADFDLYAKHEVKHVYYPSKKACNDSDNNDDNSNNADTNGHTNTTPSSFFLIECIEPDSPLDINNTTQSDSTQYDATGHCVWAGAFLLIQCIHELLEKKYFIKQLFNNNNNNNNNIGKNNNKRMIEFGCGTGIGGLAFLMLHKRDDDYDDDNDDDTDDANSTLNSNNSNSENNVVPSSVYFTDNDPDALKVCERNCKLNNLPESSYTIGELTWGEKDAEYATATTDQFDIALATDVLYDIDLIHPLFTSVSECLVRPSSASSSSSSSSSSDGCEEGGGGIFILSHIPRACYNEGNPPEAVEDLEKYIIDEAVKYGLHLVDIVRPPKKREERSEIPEDWAPAVTSFVGGGILIFRRA